MVDVSYVMFINVVVLMKTCGVEVLFCYCWNVVMLIGSYVYVDVREFDFDVVGCCVVFLIFCDSVGLVVMWEKYGCGSVVLLLLFIVMLYSCVLVIVKVWFVVR